MNKKKKIVSISLAVLFTGAVAFNMQMNADQNQNQTSQVTMENIEALANLGHEDNWSSGGGGFKCSDHCVINPLEYCALNATDANGEPITIICHGYEAPTWT